MMYSKNKKTLSIVLLLSIFSIFSCVQDDEFSVPPIICTDNFIANVSIPDMFAFNTTNAPDLVPQLNEQDVIFEGYVVSSDEAGNFFATLVLQDKLENPTRGMQVEVDVRDLFTLFPVGSKVLVNASGLYLDDDTGTLEIGETFINNGETQVGRISEVNFDSRIFRSCDEITQPTPVVYNNITDALASENLNTLITINNVQFRDVCDGETYFQEDNVLGGSTNVILQDQQGITLAVRNSSFADFAADVLPTGSGSITGVLSAFDTNGSLTPSDYQMFIRNTNDVNMTGERFTSFGTQISIADLRALYTGSTTTIPDTNPMFIRGKVISDRSNGSIQSRNIFVQDQTAGIAIRLETGNNNPFDLNEVINIKIDGKKLSEFNGLLQLNLEEDDMEADCFAQVNIEPTVVSIAQLLTGDFESQLVKLEGVQFASPGGTYSGNNNVTDGTNTIPLFTTNSFSLLASQITPSGTLDITAIAAEFNNPQILPRDIAEVGGTPPPSSLPIPFALNFDAGIPLDWQVVTTTGNRAWELDDFGGVTYVQMSAFTGGSSPPVDVVTWLITNELDFDAQAGETLSMNIADAFSNGMPLQVWYSNDYTGTGNPTAANWTRVGEAEIAALNENTGFYDNAYETAQIDLSAVTGNGYVAFVYDSANGTISTTIQISDINIQ